MTWAKVTSLFVNSEAYHEQMGPIPSSNESLDIALFNPCGLKRAHLEPSMTYFLDRRRTRIGLEIGKINTERRSLGHQVLVIRSHFISIWAIWAIVIRVTDIQFVEKNHSLSLQ